MVCTSWLASVVLIITVIVEVQSIDKADQIGSIKGLKGLEDEVLKIYKMLPNTTQTIGLHHTSADQCLRNITITEIRDALLRAVVHSMRISSFIPAIRTRCVSCIGLMPALLLETFESNNESDLVPLKQLQLKMKTEFLIRREKLESHLAVLPDINSGTQLVADALIHFGALREVFEAMLLNPTANNKNELMKECDRGHYIRILNAAKYLIGPVGTFNIKLEQDNYSYATLSGISTAIGLLIHGTLEVKSTCIVLSTDYMQIPLVNVIKMFNDNSIIINILDNYEHIMQKTEIIERKSFSNYWHHDKGVKSALCSLYAENTNIETEVLSNSIKIMFHNNYHGYDQGHISFSMIRNMSTNDNRVFLIENAANISVIALYGNSNVTTNSYQIFSCPNYPASEYYMVRTIGLPKIYNKKKDEQIENIRMQFYNIQLEPTDIHDTLVGMIKNVRTQLKGQLCHFHSVSKKPETIGVLWDNIGTYASYTFSLSDVNGREIYWHTWC